MKKGQLFPLTAKLGVKSWPFVLNGGPLVSLVEPPIITKEYFVRWEDSMDLELLAHLFFQKGWSKTKIANHLEHSRATIRWNSPKKL